MSYYIAFNRIDLCCLLYLNLMSTNLLVTSYLYRILGLSRDHFLFRFLSLLKTLTLASSFISFYFVKGGARKAFLTLLREYIGYYLILIRLVLLYTSYRY